MPVTDGNGFKSHKSDWPTPRKIGDFFLFPSSSSWKKKTTRRPKEGGGWPTIGKGCCSALFVPLHLSFRPRKNTRGGGGNALTMRNGRCCVSARAMGQARCKCVACTFYSPFFPLFPSLSLSLSLSFFSMPQRAPLKRNSLVEQVLRNWRGLLNRWRWMGSESLLMISRISGLLTLIAVIGLSVCFINCSR